MSRPNVLFLLSDEHGFRWLGHRSREDGGESVETPTLDSLAASGSQFRNAYCQMPLCTPSRLSLLTGLEPRACGAWGNNSVLRPELPTIASALGSGGYRTALIGKMHLGGASQYAGFQDRPYGDLTGRTGHQWEPLRDPDLRQGMRGRTAHTGVTEIPESLLQDQVVAQETVAWIREVEAQAETGDPQAPWFAMASFSRPHFPLTAPSRWIDHYKRTGVEPPRVPASGDAFDHPMSAGMRAGFRAADVSEEEATRARIGYAACVSYLDEVIGDLLARLEASGSLENTIIIYTTDHGEMAGEHGVWWKNGWYEACTHVPLLVSTPEQRAGTDSDIRCETPVALVDLFPTVCSMTGTATPDGLSGRDLSLAIQGGTELPLAPITADALAPRWGAGTEFRSVRFGDFKYVRFRNAEPLLFDLGADPGEQKNLLSDAPIDGQHADARAAAEYAESSIDFDACEREREDRDGGLAEEYRLSLPRVAGNLYAFPDGRLVDVDGPMLYEQSIVATDASDYLVRE